MEDQFNLVSKEYDAKRRCFIPCFDDFYAGATDFICSNIVAPKTILDLGAGTGLLTMYWAKKYPNAEYVLVDLADKMLDVAKLRFKEMNNVHYVVADYAKSLPNGKFDAIISALSIHHLENEEKENLFKSIYESLPENGLFVNYDQFSAGSSLMDSWYNNSWEKIIYHGDLSDEDLTRWQERKKFDRECSIEEEVAMLKKVHFSEVKNIYSCRKFSVVVSVK